MGAADASGAEPKPLGELVPFEEGDFHALSEGLARDPQYNDRRLLARRKLGAIAKEAAARIAAESGGSLELATRTSLHQPHAFNQMRVRRLWAYLCRDRKEKARLRSMLGAELARDLDAAYRNAYLCTALESDSLEVSLRIHPEAWYDGQNLVHRVRKEGTAMWRAMLNALPGYRLRLADWKGEWSCGELSAERLEEFLRYYRPGDHSLAVERRFPAPPGARMPALQPSVPAALVEELGRLAPLYRFTAWSAESDFLFVK
jgi:hypothetical protein